MLLFLQLIFLNPGKLPLYHYILIVFHLVLFVIPMTFYYIYPVFVVIQLESDEPVLIY
jgi:ABC-type uncharacterized transport system permease subunit